MIRFFVFSDLHYDEVDDGDKRIEDILSCAEKRNPDFIVSLGDLCHPIKDNHKVLSKFNALGAPFYNIIGNHETDQCQLSEILKFFNLERPYYSVICNGYKMVFLNTCYLKHGEQEESYYKRNFQNKNNIYPVVPSEEMKWLYTELMDDMKYIIFSHHSFLNDFANRGVYNRADIRELFRGKQELLCMNGHDHGDSFEIRENIGLLLRMISGYMIISGMVFL